jgi:hypothetical protein
MYPDWTPPPVMPPAAPTPNRRRRGLLAATGLVGAGVVAGAVIGATALSSAATSSSTPTSSASSSTSSSGEANETHRGGGHGLDLSGTVTAVGTSSVTIKTSTGTVQYAVSTSSDIDKNGESTLSKLVVGDAVTFSVDTVNKVQTIDKLHAGNEALDRPQGNSSTGG